MSTIQQTNEQQPKQSQTNGYIRSENHRLGIPGYSFIHPNHFDVPVQRNPVCLPNRQSQNRGQDSLNPAGYLGSGPSDVMEFHSVGSIMPKFDYSEETQYQEDKNNRY